MRDTVTVIKNIPDGLGNNTNSQEVQSCCKIIEEQKEIRISRDNVLGISNATILMPCQIQLSLTDYVVMSGDKHRIIKINKEEGKDITGKPHFQVIYVE